MSDVERVRMALEYGSENTPALTREPVFVWTNAEAALDRIEAEVERLREALRKVEKYGGSNTTGLFDDVRRIARAALAQPTEGQERES